MKRGRCRADLSRLRDMTTRLPNSLPCQLNSTSKKRWKTSNLIEFYPGKTGAPATACVGPVQALYLAWFKLSTEWGGGPWSKLSTAGDYPSGYVHFRQLKNSPPPPTALRHTAVFRRCQFYSFHIFVLFVQISVSGGCIQLVWWRH